MKIIWSLFDSETAMTQELNSDKYKVYIYDRFGEKETLIVATKPNQIKSIKNTKFTNSNNIYS